MLYRTFSAAIYGIEANIIEVEVDVSGVKLNEVHSIPSACRMPPSVRVKIVSAPRCAPAATTSTYAHYREPRAGRHSQGRLRLRPPHGARHPGCRWGLNKKGCWIVCWSGTSLWTGVSEAFAGLCPLRSTPERKKLTRLIVPEVNAREARHGQRCGRLPSEIADGRHPLREDGKWNGTSEGG